MRVKGWLLDAYIAGDKAILWLKLEDGSLIRLTDQYRPDFYAEPADSDSIEEIVGLVLNHPNVEDVRVEEKFTSLEASGKKKVLHIYLDHPKSQRRVIKTLEDSGLFRAFFNIDLLHIQRYLFHKNWPPTQRVEIEYADSELRGINLLDDSREIEPPPFKTLIYSIEPPGDGEIQEITLYRGTRPYHRLRGGEKNIIMNFNQHIAANDPDILVSPHGYDDVKHLHRRAEKHEVHIQIGREKASKPLTAGRIPLRWDFYLEYGICGAVERARFSLVPPRLCADWPAGKLIDSRQCYEAMKRGLLIPGRGFYIESRTALEVLLRDRGGFILAPEAGLHENVAELDYESLYPNIIAKEDISYETVKSRCGDGLLKAVALEALNRRLYFKHLKRRLPKECKEWLWCDQRSKALKGILVCVYGYSGCFANRFGNIATFEEINRIAREKLVETMNIALEEGFQVVYADTDSIFVKREDASREDYERLAYEISRKIGFPLALDHHYKFVVFLKRRTDPRIEVAKRYFGKLQDGSLHYRGIELRRQDTPPFIKDFQEKLMRILFDADSIEEVRRRQLAKALAYVEEAYRRVKSGRVDWRKLVISKRLNKGVREYRCNLPHVTVAKQLSLRGLKPAPGSLMEYIILNEAEANPYRRVASIAFLKEGGASYDREKYAELLLEAAETILGVFGFNKERFKSKMELKPLNLMEVIKGTLSS